MKAQVISYWEILQKDVVNFTECQLSKLEASALLLIENPGPDDRLLGFYMLGIYYLELKRRWF